MGRAMRKGPYIDATVISTVQADTVIETGFGAGVLNDIALFNTLNNDADDFATPTAAAGGREGAGGAYPPAPSFTPARRRFQGAPPPG